MKRSLNSGSIGVALITLLILSSCSEPPSSRITRDSKPAPEKEADSQADSLEKKAVTEQSKTEDPAASAPSALPAAPLPEDAIPAPANSIAVDSVEALHHAISTLVPGDHLLLADGEYKDIGELAINVSGTPEQPIVIRPLNPHQVTITGLLRLRLHTNHLIIHGLTFDRCRKVPSTKYYDSLIDSPYSSRGIRFTACRFLSCEVEQRENGSIKGNLITLRGEQHRVDHCFFYDPLSGMLGLNGDKANMEKRIKGEVRIDHNIFRDMSRLRALEGQGEAIFMGSGFAHLRTQPLGAIIEYNIFDRAIGDTHGEIITVKSSDNIFRYNLFVNSPGAWFEGGSHLSLRHTDNCVVSHNLFQNLGCGIWVTGRNHQITDNAFIDIDFAGLHFSSGNIQSVEDDVSVTFVGDRRIEMSSSDAYPVITAEYGAVFWAAENNTITGNYFADLKKLGIYSRDNKKSKHGFIPPKNNRINGNLFQVTFQVEQIPLMHIDQPQHNEMKQNVYVTPPSINRGKVGTEPQILEVVPTEWNEKLAKLKSQLPAVPPMPGSLKDQPLAADFKTFPSKVRAKQNLMIDAAFSAGDITIYNWDFGDGHTASDSGNAIAHTWEKPGEYEVTLMVTDVQGNTSRSSLKIQVN